MFMKVAAYADDAREPDLIGEGLVDLTEVITKGESDGANDKTLSTPIHKANHLLLRVVHPHLQGQICG